MKIGLYPMVADILHAGHMLAIEEAKSKLNNKWSRIIYMAAKSGIPDPELNQNLKKEIEKYIAKNINLHRQKIGMVFQQFNLFNNLNVIENITLAPVLIAKKKIKSAKRKNFFIFRA